MYTEAIALSGSNAGHVAMPAKRPGLGQGHTGFVPIIVEQAKVDALGDFGKYGEVATVAVIRGAQGVPRAGPNGCAGERFAVCQVG